MDVAACLHLLFLREFLPASLGTKYIVRAQSLSFNAHALPLAGDSGVQGSRLGGQAFGVGLKYNEERCGKGAGQGATVGAQRAGPD